jgi:hypothetical protein
MDINIQKLVELARAHQITAEEHEAQVKSFTYGNTHFENSEITREDVSRAVAAIKFQEPAAL